MSDNETNVKEDISNIEMCHTCDCLATCMETDTRCAWFAILRALNEETVTVEELTL